MIQFVNFLRRIYAAAPSTSANEAIGADGGFAVPHSVALTIISAVRDVSLAGRCGQVTVESNNITLPVDGVAPWADTHFSWESELAPLTPTKPSLSANSTRLARIVGLIPVSEELLEDAPGLDNYVRVNLVQKLSSKLNTAIVRGTGAGQMQGILQSGCLITEARGVSVAATAATMWKRLPGESQQRAAWLVNPSVEVPSTPGLPKLLEGAPVIGVEACSAPGSKGDIILADLAAYQIAMRTLRLDQSLHMYFDAAAAAYRVTLRIQGQPLWAAPVAPQFGTDTRSPFITAAA